MNNSNDIVIVGAGPSGLAMALFLNDLSYRPTIIEKNSGLSNRSKALGVNPRTLNLLERSGITSKFLSNGRKLHAFNLWKADKFIYRNDFSKQAGRYPFMLIQPQKESEEILYEEVVKRNLEVKFNSRFKSYTQAKDHFNINIEGPTSSIQTKIIIGADGVHSEVRQKMGSNFTGLSYDEEWELYDVELDMDINQNEGHYRLFPEGGMIMIRIKDSIWRIAGNMKSLLNYLPKGTEIGQIYWQSKFRIHHKLATFISTERLVLIGDASHTHSPVGARGMNLGIEDSFIASQLIAQNRLVEYNQLRRPQLKKVIKRINTITSMTTGSSRSSKLFRNQLGNLSFIFPLLMPMVRKFLMGDN